MLSLVLAGLNPLHLVENPWHLVDQAKWQLICPHCGGLTCVGWWKLWFWHVAVRSRNYPMPLLWLYAKWWYGFGVAWSMQNTNTFLESRSHIIWCTISKWINSKHSLSPCHLAQKRSWTTSLSFVMRISATPTNWIKYQHGYCQDCPLKQITLHHRTPAHPVNHHNCQSWPGRTYLYTRLIMALVTPTGITPMYNRN